MVKTRPNIIVSLSGMPKSGKTYLSFTFPEPIKIYSFDMGADFVRTKFKNKKIDIHNFYLPIIDTDPPPPYAEKIWNDFSKQFKEDAEQGKYETLVIDTATALWAICHQAIVEEKNRKKILEVEYFLPNLRMSALFARARASGVNLVTTQYLKDKYVDEKNTGQQIVDGWGRTEGQVDISIWMEAINTSNSHAMKSTIMASRFDRELVGKTYNDLTYGQLMAALGIEEEE